MNDEEEDATVVGKFGSYHPGGALFTFADGSTRFLSDNIDTTLFRQFGNRADGELMDLGMRNWFQDPIARELIIKIRCHGGFLVFSKIWSEKSFLQLADTSSIRMWISRVEMIRKWP